MAETQLSMSADSDDKKLTPLKSVDTNIVISKKRHNSENDPGYFLE